MTKNSHDRGLLDAALYYVRNGFSLTPLQPFAKQPYLMKVVGDKEVMTINNDEKEIEAFWREHPLHNIGLAMGKYSNALALDIDGEQGERSLARLQHLYEYLPPTAEVRTGKGRHLYYRSPTYPESTISQIGKNLDIIANNGYVVAPPSIHPTGRPYAWANTLPIVKAPQWLTDLSTVAAIKDDNHGWA